MRVKAFLEVDRDEYINSCLIDTMVRIKMARRHYAFHRKTFFPGEKSIPFNQEVVFARLYEKIGRDNYAVRSLKALRIKYLKEIGQIWADYYTIVSRCNASSAIALMAERQMREYQDQCLNIEYALRFFEDQRRRTFVKWPPEISEFVAAIQSGNFSAFYDLFERHRMNWHNIAISGHRLHEIARAFKKSKYK